MVELPIECGSRSSRSSLAESSLRRAAKLGCDVVQELADCVRGPCIGRGRVNGCEVVVPHVEDVPRVGRVGRVAGHPTNDRQRSPLPSPLPILHRDTPGGYV